MIELPPGTTFGPYVLGTRLGVGGMGAVYAAQTPEGARVALKLLALGADPEDLARFEREAEAHARVDTHPSVARVHSAGVHLGQPYLVMDLLPGGDLDSRLRLGPLPPEDVRALGVALARGVAHVHAQGVLHRDIKPANVLFDEHGSPRLTDFGLARPVEASSLTQSGTLLGTPGYMAPEQTGTAPATTASDVFGLGATLYGALTGRPPFAGATVIQSLHLLLSEPPPPLPAHVPPDLRAAILRALEKDPADRFPSAEAFANALETPAPSPGPLALGPAPRAALGVLVFGLVLGVAVGIQALGGGARSGSTVSSELPTAGTSSPVDGSPGDGRAGRPSPSPHDRTGAAPIASRDWVVREPLLLEPGEAERAKRAPTRVVACWLDARRFATVADNGLVQIWEPGPVGRPAVTTTRLLPNLEFYGSSPWLLALEDWLIWPADDTHLQTLPASARDPQPPLRTLEAGALSREVLPGARLLLFSERAVSLWRPGAERSEWTHPLRLPDGAALAPNASLLLSEARDGVLTVLLAWIPRKAASETALRPRLERVRLGPQGVVEQIPLGTSEGRMRCFVHLGGRIYCGDEVGNVLLSDTPEGPFRRSELLRPGGNLLGGAHQGPIRGVALGPAQTLVTLGSETPDLSVWRPPNSRIETVDLSARKRHEPALYLRVSPDRRFALVQFRTQVALVPLRSE